ncbi:unnamed protein product [Mytilus edulis]|uniref:Uncharacterized protein n=1 Tax=Mytilus edulis TaxID=6550 RepID=A0A8S3U7T7_MYTED|nr:unnamed protein product [Mytilus edulis]
MKPTTIPTLQTRIPRVWGQTHNENYHFNIANKDTKESTNTLQPFLNTINKDTPGDKHNETYLWGQTHNETYHHFNITNKDTIGGQTHNETTINTTNKDTQRHGTNTMKPFYHFNITNKDTQSMWTNTMKPIYHFQSRGQTHNVTISTLQGYPRVWGTNT